MNELDIAIESWNAHRTGCRHAILSGDAHRASCDTAQRIWNEIVRAARSQITEAVREIHKR